MTSNTTGCQKQQVAYDRLIQEAADLDPYENSEYMRGMCELIARCFPKHDYDTADRADEIRQEVINRMYTERRAS